MDSIKFRYIFNLLVLVLFFSDFLFEESSPAVHAHNEASTALEDDEESRSGAFELGSGWYGSRRAGVEVQGVPAAWNQLARGVEECGRERQVSYHFYSPYRPVLKRFRFLFQTFRAVDANFRLNNRLVSSLLRDPIMGDGLGYFVNYARYIEYILKFVDQEEISTCAGFQALLLAYAKRLKGMRTTGVGGCTCPRHNMWEANGIGDLQKGER